MTTLTLVDVHTAVEPQTPVISKRAPALRMAMLAVAAVMAFGTVMVAGTTLVAETANAMGAHGCVQ